MYYLIHQVQQTNRIHPHSIEKLNVQIFTSILCVKLNKSMIAANNIQKMQLFRLYSFIQNTVHIACSVVCADIIWLLHVDSFCKFCACIEIFDLSHCVKLNSIGITKITKYAIANMQQKLSGLL